MVSLANGPISEPTAKSPITVDGNSQGALGDGAVGSFGGDSSRGFRQGHKKDHATPGLGGRSRPEIRCFLGADNVLRALKGAPSPGNRDFFVSLTRGAYKEID